MKMLVTYFKSRRNNDVMWWALYFYSCTILRMTDFHELLPFSQCSDLTTTICNTARPQLNSDRFIQHMTSETVQKMFLNYPFAFDTRYGHFFNLKLLYSGYLSQTL